MGGFASAALPLVMSGVKTYAESARQRAALRAGQAQTNRLAAIERQRQSAAERKRKQELKHRLASQRARFGASGLGAGGGSASAVLRGLERNAADDLADTRFESALRLQDINKRRKQNLLESSGAFNRIIFSGWEKKIPRKGPLLG